MHLDLIITADTALAHLAGAMNRPAWIALQFASDFRWFLERTDSPWYPSLRLFRQSERREWSEVFENIAAELAKSVALAHNPTDFGVV
jgi:ADP-heptose:LPS heptosyltransferase